MGLVGDILGGISGLIGAGTGIANSVLQNQQADDNLALSQESFNWNKNFQEKNFEYQKFLNEQARSDSLSLYRQTMAREDNAVQRRAADLEAAGFSRHLAAGQGANASSFSMPSSQAAGGNTLSAPQRAFTQLQLSNTVINDMVGVLEGVERVARSREERLLLADQRNLITAQIAEKEANTGWINTKKSREDFKSRYEQEKEHPLEYLMTPISAHAGLSGLSFTGPYGMGGDINKSLQQYVKDTKDLLQYISLDKKMSFKERAGAGFRGMVGNTASFFDRLW